MTVNKNTHAPFGTKTKRFDALGYHPSLETRPGTYNYSNLFPGCYEYWLKPRRIISKVTRYFCLSKSRLVKVL